MVIDTPRDGEPVRLIAGDRVLVVANPATRRDVRRAVAALSSHAPEGVTIDVRVTTRAGEARALARDNVTGARLIVAVGGDGTVAEVGAAVMGRNVPLAVMPGGSTNIIARELRIPTHPDAGARLIFGEHRVRSLDAGESDRRVFLHMAGGGFDSRLFARSNSRLKRRIGWLAYLPAAARALADRPSEVRVTVDGIEASARSPLVLVANGRAVVHPMLHIAQGISKSDGMLDVFIVTATRPWELARVLGSVATRNLGGSPYVTRMRGREVALDATPAFPVQFDGDVDGDTPVVFRVVPDALRILVPVIPPRAAPAR